MVYALSEAHAHWRREALSVESYRIELDLRSAPTSSTTFEATSHITFTSTQPEVDVDYLGEAVTGVLVDGQPVEYSFDGSRVFVTVPTGRAITLTIRGASAYSRTGQGLHRFTDPADGRTYLYSHFEPSDARRVFPCFDQPDLKAAVTTVLRVPQGWQALANGAVESRDGDKVRFTPTPPLSTYLVAFAAGEYVATRSQWRDMEIALWCRASMAEHVDDEFLEITARGLDFFHEHFGYPYPWGTYDSILVPEYNLGAMENPGLVTFTEKYLFSSRATRAQRAARANTILHEMSHMWFGDLVTPRWWDDLWLKESFAEFMGADASQHATDYVEAWANFAGVRKNWAYQQDQLPTTHPIAAVIADVDAARQNFDGITYAKGAAVLRQLVHYIGRENFYAGARQYFRDHAFGNATYADLLGALEPYTDADLKAWSDAWLKTSGPDVLRARREGDVLHIAHEGTRPHRLDVGCYAGGELTQRMDVLVEADAAEVTVSLPGGVDAVIVNDTDHAYALTRFDEESLTWLLAHLSEVGDELTRAVVWTSLWNATRDGELSVARFVAAAVKHAPVEPNPSMIAQVLSSALAAAADYTDEEITAVELHEGLLAALRAAEPGSDAQLAITRAAIVSAAGRKDTTWLHGVLSGTVDGLAVDDDVRWAVLAALSAAGADSEELIDAQLAQDDSLTGRASALRARWSVPTKETKKQLWAEVTRPAAWSNAEVEALLAAFNAPGHGSLRESVTSQFAAEVTTWWREHPIEIAQRLVRGLFPDSPLGEQQWEKLHEQMLPPALDRVLKECQDQAQRRRRVRGGPGRLAKPIQILLG
ncbi:aminopeptidase N [Corynebacterium uterequi]|uniref:Aminopeptidase N n=1 Tax=Corynebacterium uterequi TaxID=1072256 RepID=A0A0G3HF65_9CORY|nr:aminopeptidase N [Corynebacterium uterequi]AKK11375.1 aminopeptidase N [Corynebacterium uterequi]